MNAEKVAAITTIAELLLLLCAVPGRRPVDMALFRAGNRHSKTIVGFTQMVPDRILGRTCVDEIDADWAPGNSANR